MRYEGNIFRPPSEAYSLIVQVTIGCTHNSCTFCSAFKAKKFRIRDIKEVLTDFDMARKYYKHVGRIFLADADALVLSNEKLLIILNYIKKLFPECERVSIYGSARDIHRKTVDELVELKENGIAMIYIGAETGSDKVLVDVNKRSTREEIITAIRKVEDTGIMSSVTFISGLGGIDNWREHAIETGTMISLAEPSYVGLLTLMVEPRAPLYADVKSGKFKLLSPEQVVVETILLLENINVNRNCVFRSNHASNYVSLKGDLPKDKERMLEQLESAVKNPASFKDERFRAL